MNNLTKEKVINVMSQRASSLVLVGFIFSCLIAYIYFANVAVRSLTLLEKSKREMQNLSVSVSEMESKRLALDYKVNKETATNLGLVEVKSQLFIVNKTEKTLSLK